MKNSIQILRLSALALILAIVPASGRTSSPGSDRNESDRSRFAIEMLRVINTEEASFKHEIGRYGSWEELAGREKFANRLTNLITEAYPRLRTLKISANLNVLPGWRIRLNLSGDGQSYDLRFEDLSDEKCGYAAISDESGVIRQSKAIDCEI